MITILLDKKTTIRFKTWDDFANWLAEVME
jgi:hypothetical protein